MHFKRHFLLSVAALSVGVLLSACNKPASEPAAAAPAAPAPTPAARVVTVGTDPTYAPFEFQNEKGEIVGFDIDVVRAAAQKAGLEVKFVSTPWEGAINALTQGDRDLLVSAITITDERKQSIDFTEPYFEASQLIAVSDRSTATQLADLKKSKIGVQTSTTGEEVVVKLLGKTNSNIKRFESTPLALSELAAGGVDAVVADNGVISHYLANNPSTKFKALSDPSFAPEFYGLALKKGNTELQALLNKGLADIKADGSYQKIYDQYFAPAAK
nr:basic amino acid ABC transporter substrate-binding protein [uncultured Albidiferax sp.]